MKHAADSKSSFRDPGTAFCYRQKSKQRKEDEKPKASHPDEYWNYYLKPYISDLCKYSQWRPLGVELDLYSPPRSLAIEYDGQAWHKRTSAGVDMTSWLYVQGAAYKKNELTPMQIEKLEELGFVWDLWAERWMVPPGGGFPEAYGESDDSFRI